MAFGRQHETHSEWLAGVPLFAGMDSSELDRVAALGEKVDVPVGEVLVDQGDAGTFCYVILEGTAAVYVNGEYVATSGAGTTVGEMALIDHRPRTATVVATGPMSLLRFDTQRFRQLLEELPRASERIMAILSSRLDR